jgi:predicted small secreted protein
MKTNKMILIIALLSAVITTGCTTTSDGTKRKVTVAGNAPGTATLETRSKKETKSLPAVFNLHTRRDRGEMSLVVADNFGNKKSIPLYWVNTDNTKMYGGAIIGTVVFGVFGPASLATDLYTMSYKDVSDNVIVVDILSMSMSPNGSAGQSATSAPPANVSATKKPCTKMVWGDPADLPNGTVKEVK